MPPPSLISWARINAAKMYKMHNACLSSMINVQWCTQTNIWSNSAKVCHVCFKGSRSFIGKWRSTTVPIPSKAYHWIKFPTSLTKGAGRHPLDHTERISTWKTLAFRTCFLGCGHTARQQGHAETTSEAAKTLPCVEGQVPNNQPSGLTAGEMPFNFRWGAPKSPCPIRIFFAKMFWQCPPDLYPAALLLDVDFGHSPSSNFYSCWIKCWGKHSPNLFFLMQCHSQWEQSTCSWIRPLHRFDRRSRPSRTLVLSRLNSNALRVAKTWHPRLSLGCMMASQTSWSLSLQKTERGNMKWKHNNQHKTFWKWVWGNCNVMRSQFFRTLSSCDLHFTEKVAVPNKCVWRTV